MDNATEWQEVFKTAAKTALILVILDLLRLSKNATWFEVRVLLLGISQLLALTSLALTGARRLRVHAGGAFQRRSALLVGANAHARAPPSAAD